jgi:hypothetical protein
LPFLSNPFYGILYEFNTMSVSIDLLLLAFF